MEFNEQNELISKIETDTYIAGRQILGAKYGGMMEGLSKKRETDRDLIVTDNIVVIAGRKRWEEVKEGVGDKW